MKKISTLLFAGLLCTITMNANGQSKKYVLFEHFTQASCGPCAAQNPAFEGVASQNVGNIHHVAYHTSWPGVDPMYTANPTEIDAATAFYAVSGVPSMTMLGNQWTGGPAGVTQGMIDNAKAPGSPISVKVVEVDNGATRDVTVTITTTGTAPAGSFVFRLAAVEKMVTYPSPPGSNGEEEFPNVFRKFIANGQAGDAITLASMGGSITLNYTYTEDPTWNSAQIYTLGWVQNTTTKEVINSGASTDPEWYVSQPSGLVDNGVSGVETNFDAQIENLSGASNNFTVTLSSLNAPAGWTADFTIGGSSYTTTASIAVAGGGVQPIVVNVTPNTAAGIATYIITVENTTEPTDPISTSNFNIMANVTDLIVSNEGFGNGGTFDWESIYVNGLIAAGNTGYAATKTGVFEAFAANGLSPDVYNIYYNMGWTFPALTNNLVGHLENFMDGGNNLFIAGQDIGWAAFDPAGDGTPATQSFYNNYMNASYGSDGSTALTSLNAVATDAVFGGVATSTISDVYGGGNLFPDIITPLNGAVGIFKYGTGTNIGGVRAELNGYKVVYMGVGMEHLTTAGANAILSLSHDWFYGLVSAEELDALLNLGQNFPNPAVEITTIPMPELTENVTLKVTDFTGRVIYEQVVAVGTTEVQISTNNFKAGMYHYTLNNSEGALTSAKTMEVIH